MRDIVYIVVREIPYEGGEVVSVHSSFELAERSLPKDVTKHGSQYSDKDEYFYFTIEKHFVADE